MARLTRGNRSIAGRVAIVTGAASGMGRATAHLFADEGAKVAVADLTEAGVKAVVDEINTAGVAGEAHGWVLDVSRPERITQVVGEIVERFGGVDILVNNAGVAHSAPTTADDATFEDAWSATMDVNLTAHIRLIRACLPYLQAKGEGRIVNIASTEGLGATAGLPAYTASKHGVVGLTRSLAVELGSQGVTVNCICPGPIRTGMTANIPEDAKNKFARRRVPLRRYAEPEEVAHGTLNFVLPASGYINGAVLPVDGGMMAQNT
jgi:3-oxoacyl-[acyl-carrier protein] reductase